MTTPALARGLTIRRGHRAVLEQLDLEVRAGEVLGIIGPNGGGKSTLLLALAGLLRPASGEVLVAGAPAHRVALDHTGTVGLITAAPGLYPLLTGWENLVFFGGLYGVRAPEVRARVTPVAASLHVLDGLDRRVAEGSSGMQQKISLLRALLMRPSLLLLDEPTANLDPISAAHILEVARRQADEGRAVVWVTHDLLGAERVCDRVLLVDGTVLDEVVFEGPRRPTEEGPLASSWRRHVGAS